MHAWATEVEVPTDAVGENRRGRAHGSLQRRRIRILGHNSSEIISKGCREYGSAARAKTLGRNPRCNKD